jgi:hypothetical protein
MSATPSVLAHNGDYVTVAWSGVPAPTSKDVISLYMPPDATSPMYAYAVTTAPAWHSGAGSLSIRLVNMRAPYRFAYTNGSGLDVASSGAVAFAARNEPLEAHLQLAPQNHADLLVMWTMADLAPDAVVLYGTQSGSNHSSYPYKAAASGVTFTIADMAGAPANTSGAWLDPGYIYSAVLTGLTPGVRYYYVYGAPSLGGDSGAWSPERTFVAPPPQNNPNRETKLTLLGDMGCQGAFPYSYPEAPQTIARVLGDVAFWGTELVLDVGDIAYGRGHGRVWGVFMDAIEAVATRVPFMTTLGNHEWDDPSVNWNPGAGVLPVDYNTDSGGEAGVPYAVRFGFAPYGVRQHWYAFEYANVHVTVASGEHDFLPDSEQLMWIERDWAAVDRAVTPWLLLAVHRPMYSDADTPPEFAMMAQMRKSFEPLLAKYKVDLVFAGHIHAYERSCPISFDGQCVTSAKESGSKQKTKLMGSDGLMGGDGEDVHGTVHVVGGAAGHTYQVPWEWDTPEWSVYRTLQWGRVRLHIHNASVMDVEFRANHDDTRMDAFTIVH